MLDPSHICDLHYIAHSNAGSLTHWARPGIEPTTTWFLVRFINHWATMDFLNVLEINPAWSWWIAFITCYWIWFADILFIIWPSIRVPIVAQRKGIQLGTMRLQVHSLVSINGLRIQRYCELWCRSQMRLRSPHTFLDWFYFKVILTSHELMSIASFDILCVKLESFVLWKSARNCWKPARLDFFFKLLIQSNTVGNSSFLVIALISYIFLEILPFLISFEIRRCCYSSYAHLIFLISSVFLAFFHLHSFYCLFMHATTLFF